MRVNKWIVLLLQSLAWGAGTAAAAEVYIGLPTAGGKRIDICYEWGMQCAGEAAEAWCKAQGFDRAIEWQIDHDIGATHPTLVIGSGQVCAEAHCDGYFSITCAREDEWTRGTGLGGLMVEVNRSSQQSPEGILIVAVSAQDPSQSASGVVDVNSHTLLHTPPGQWRLFALNFNNPQPINPHLGLTAEVNAGKDGGYYALTVD